ncbi:LPS export ABC transporter permease LptF [Mailhella massiliensis]|uniref:LPS export ABC transporter permease LptF n=1 Tax=Mailhella massiliensis TaxID=1903261 RepID=A0A921AWB9_9BACT|nr:LPS export ABC transporter permease LptF [Mailhella massiliensis]HJD97515.1 LPS export ABC transporter permease LptF [Mailhella massiliensis]
MNLLQRRLFMEHAKTFFLSMAVLLLFILMGRALQLRDMLLGLELNIWDTLRLFGYLSPFFLLIICPIACMLSVFLTFLRMSTDRELVALKAGGVSLYQMLPAPLLFSVFCALFGFWISFYWQAWGMGNFRSEVLSIASSSARVVVQPGVFNKDVPNMVMFARKVDPVSGTMAGVMVEDRRAADTTMTILAPDGSLDADYENGEIIFLLKNGRSYTEKDNALSIMGFQEYAVRLSFDSLFQGVDMGPVKPKEYTWARLYDYENERALQKTDPRMARKIVVERHKRFVFPLACVVLCIFVIPIATSFQGLKQQTGVLMALLLFLVYYSLLMLGISLGESGDLTPTVGLWAPNLVFLLLGLYGMRLAAQERMPRITEHWQSRRSRKKKKEDKA